MFHLQIKMSPLPLEFRHAFQICTSAVKRNVTVFLHSRIVLLSGFRTGNLLLVREYFRVMEIQGATVQWRYAVQLGQWVSEAHLERH